MSGELRIGDAERDQVTAALREHYAQGRLTREELDERLELALTSKTASELSRATTDLPGPTSGPGARPFHPGPPPLPGLPGLPGSPGSSGFPGLPGPWQHAPERFAAWREEAERHGLAWPPADRDAWRAALRAHRQEMRRLRHEAHARRRHTPWPHDAAAWSQGAGWGGPMSRRRGRPGYPWGPRRGPGPFVPLLLLALAAGLIFGGFGVLKVLLALWIGSMVFHTVRRVRQARS
ncbi:DUF1707 domain-containing protein [Nonomuraea sp. NPDC050328]|uniref:DUF1707 domain-containing protein n=1 Tax=Nonomuraea sp. NPDC050328 TaxID=3364361 RepID=UPI0037ABC69D